MIGFYLTIFKDRLHTDDIELMISDSGAMESAEIVQKNRLILFNDKKAQHYSSGDYTFYSIGTFIYKKSWGIEAVKKLDADINNGMPLAEIFSESSGQFALLIFNKGTVHLITDKLGSFPVFKFESDKKICISNIFRYVCKVNDLSLNHQAVAEYLSIDYVFGNSLFHEVDLLKECSIYSFNHAFSSSTYHNYLDTVQFDTYKNIDEVSELSIQVLTDALSVFADDKKLFCDLTGGFDTRTISVLMHRLGISFSCGICGEQNVNETQIARDVADRLGYTFNSDIKIDTEPGFNTCLDHHYKISGGVPILYHSTELINYYSHIAQHFDLHLGGFAGSQLIDNWLPRLSLISKTMNTPGLLFKSFLFADLFKDNVLSPEYYYDHVTNKLHKIYEKVGSDRYDYVSNYLTLTTFSKYYHGYLIGTHNTILPVYVPFLEAGFVKLMMETSSKIKQNRRVQRVILSRLNPDVSRIMTTHGYSAGVEKVNLKKFVKVSVKDLQRRLIYSNSLLRNNLLGPDSYFSKRKNNVRLAELQRNYWLDRIQETWSDTHQVFNIIDEAKLKRYLDRDTYPSKTKAKIIYLDKLMNEFSPRIVR